VKIRCPLIGKASYELSGEIKRLSKAIKRRVQSKEKLSELAGTICRASETVLPSVLSKKQHET